MLTVLPLFHVGGLNIQTTPALQLGATVTLHRALRAGRRRSQRIARDRPTLTVLVPATIQAVIEHPRWADDRSRQPARGHHRLDAGAAAAGRCVHRARRAGAAGLWLDRDLPDRGLYARRRRLERAGSTGLPGLCARRASSMTPAARSARHAGRGGGARAERVLRILGQRGGDARGAARRLVSHRRHRHARCRRAISSSTTARRT